MIAKFKPSRAKLRIASLDDPTLQVQAQYNPKELQIERQITWGDHDPIGGQPAASGGGGDSEQSDLELKGAPKRSMTIELFFDYYEHPGLTVERHVERLEEMSSVQEPGAPSEKLRRPHHCVVTWGVAGVGTRPFRCVIESLTTKYMMWDPVGIPVRATCTVKLKEANRMSRR